MSDTLFNSIYNPDVLECIANLSNDEVFTPPSVANAMLDMLPQELFRSPDTKFLDPATKSGVFLREIAKRLLVGLEDQIPDLQERVDHIFHNQLYGIAITELTSHLARRSVYCSKYASGKYSVSHFDTVDGNIRFKNTPHRWVNGKCVFCAASEKEYGGKKREGMETHAYEVIHTIKPQEIWNMKFDVIISNPPYQLSDGGNSASALPIYQKFVQQAKKLSPRYLSMIMPARWFSGGRGLDDFRNEMLHDNRIRVIHDYMDAGECFPGVEIKGGVCYFLWDRDNPGLCEVFEHKNNKVSSTIRPLLEEGMESFIRSQVQLDILRKVHAQKVESLSTILQGGRFFGFHTKIVWDDSLHGRIQTADGKDYIPMTKNETNNNTVKVFIHGGTCYMNPKSIPKNAEKVNHWKIIIPRSGNPYSTILGKPRLSPPKTCSSNSFVVALLSDKNDNKECAMNLLSYLQSKLLRFLVSIKSSTQDIPPKAYELVPIQDFSKRITDEDLYKKYHLNDAEIEYIEESIAEMVLNGGEEDAE